MAAVSQEALAEFRDLACGYGKTAIVRNLNFSLDSGAFWALIGANGSGKSTFLKTVAGLLPPVSGTLAFPGSGADRPKIGYIPQTERFDVIFPVTVEEVVLLGASARLPAWRRIGSRERDLSRQALQRIDMEDAAGRRFSQLSGGQRQRVLLARALATEPDLLVLDEPTSGIDRQAERTFVELIAEVNSRGVAVLMASHNLALVREFADQAAWFHGGGAEIGPADEIVQSVSATAGGEERL